MRRNKKIRDNPIDERLDGTFDGRGSYLLKV